MMRLFWECLEQILFYFLHPIIPEQTLELEERVLGYMKGWVRSFEVPSHLGCCKLKILDLRTGLIT